MKRQIFITMVCLMATVMQAQTDSIRTETLSEIVVNADTDRDGREDGGPLSWISNPAERML